MKEVSKTKKYMKSTTKMFKVIVKEEFSVNLIMAAMMFICMAIIKRSVPQEDFIGQAMFYNFVGIMSLTTTVAQQLISNDLYRLFCFERKAYLNSKIMCIFFRALFIGVFIVILMASGITESFGFDKSSIGEGTNIYFATNLQLIIQMITFVSTGGLIGLLDEVINNTFSLENKSIKKLFIFMIGYIAYVSIFQMCLSLLSEDKWIILFIVSWIINIILIVIIKKKYSKKKEI